MDKAPFLLGLCKLSALAKFAFVVFNVGRIPQSVEKSSDFSIVGETFNLAENECSRFLPQPDSVRLALPAPTTRRPLASSR